MMIRAESFQIEGIVLFQRHIGGVHLEAAQVAHASIRCYEIEYKLCIEFTAHRHQEATLCQPHALEMV